jgi:N-acetylmuramoyl-L-alanine amidase
MITRARILVAAALLGISLPAQAQPAAPPVESMYADAVSKEMAVHAALVDPKAQPTALKAVRTVVGDYEAIVRAYPSSGYSDDALWRAGLVSIDAFNKFGDAHDRDTAIRLLHSLSTQYPTSKLAKNVPAVLAPLAQPAAPQSAITHLQSAIATSTITSVTRAVLPDAVRVTIEIDAEVPFHDERIAGPDRIFVDFPSTKTVEALTDKTLRFDGDSEPVHQVRIGRHTEDSTRVVLDANGVSGYSVYLLYNPYRLVIDCVRAPVAPGEPVQTTAAPPKPSAVASASRPAAKPVAPALKGRLLLPDLVFGLAGLSPGTGALQHLFDPEPADAGTTASAAWAPVTVPPAAPVSASPDRSLAGGFSFARQLGLGVSRVVIDPGHGGHDPGAPGKGVSEAEVVLDVSLRLEKLLQKAGVEVILTRKSDDFVSLQERTAIANRERADLFLSIHANASSNGLARGIETYYLNFASNMTSAAVAARENAASGQSMGAAPDFARSIALNNKLDESRDFATDVQRAMIEKLKPTNKTVRDLGVKQAPFMVLIGAAMPSALAEISFVTNEPEAKLLKGSAYRQRIAEALFAAVRTYQTSLKSLSTALARP